MPDLVGQTLLNQYHVDAFIAHTPLGDSYRATDTRSNKAVGIIILPRSITHDTDSLKQIENDAKPLRNIRHPNLVPYYGLLQTATDAFLLEDWIDGPKLQQILEHAPLSVPETLVYLKAICAGLQALHQQGYLHLALAPELIHIDQRGQIFLSGIGGARPVRSKGFLRAGKAPPIYAAPEQFRHEPLTSAADIYALATLVYQLTTGKWISGRVAPRSLESLRGHHLETVPPAAVTFNRSIPDHFSRMLTWALRKSPGERFKTTTEILSSLALAAGVRVEEVPLRADPTTAPVTARVLNEWEFLPPPTKSILADDRERIDERIAKASAPPARRTRPRFHLLPALGLIFLAGFISLFFFIRPAPVPAAPTPVYLTPFVAAQFTPPPTITPTPKPTHAPGNRIAFTCTRGDYNQLCLINSDGSGFAQISDMAASNYYPIFLPQGGGLVFSSNRNGSFDLFMLSFDEGQLFQITQDIGNVVSPDFSPDGSRIVFVNTLNNDDSSIWVVNADGLNPHMIYRGINTIVSANWSPDGTKIAFAMSRGIFNEYEIFVMDSNGKNSTQISRNLLGVGGSIDWSPDSKYLLIYAGPVGDKDIFRIDVATGDSVQLTFGGNNAAATYSRDGQYIAFNSLRNDDQADIYVMNADGTDERQLTDDPEPDWGPRWEP